MDKKKNTSAGEINKFTYCPHQWYYERVYGQKALREMYRLMNPDTAKAVLENPNIKRGRKFHRRYETAVKIKLALRVCAALLAFLLALALFGYWSTVR